MKRKLIISANLLAALIAVLGWSGLSSVSAATQTLVPLDSAGDQGNGQLCGAPATSLDGRYVAFSSSSSNLVSGDTNGVCDIFLRDTQAGTTSIESVATDGTEMSDPNQGFHMTRNGKYILMGASGSVYLRDAESNTTQLVIGAYHVGSTSRGYSGNALSEDGRFVYYVEGSTVTGEPGMYVKDMLLGTSTRVDAAADGTPANASPVGAMSTDCSGRFVIFGSNATNLVPGESGGLYLVDTAGPAHTVTYIANSDSAVITCDGNSVIYNGDSSSLDPGGLNGGQETYKYDVVNGTSIMISTDASGGSYSATCSTGCVIFAQRDDGVSMDGRYVAFTYGVSASLYSSIWIKDTITGSLTEASQSVNNLSNLPAVTSDARGLYYVYQSASGQPNRLYVAADYL